MINIFYHKTNKNKKLVLPDSFNELTGKQLIAIAALNNQGVAEDVHQLKVMKILLGLSLLRFFMLHASIKHSLLMLVGWVYNENTLTEQLIPEYKGYYGPKSAFNNLTLGEFHFSEVFYSELINADVAEDKEAAIDKLVAVLYRRPKPNYNMQLDTDGDIRVAFNANEVDYYAAKIARWPYKVKLAIVFFYDGCRQHLVELYDTVFAGNSGNDNDAGMFGVIRGLSGNRYGDIDKVERIMVHTALLELEYQIEEAKALESANKS